MKFFSLSGKKKILENSNMKNEEISNNIEISRSKQAVRKVPKTVLVFTEAQLQTLSDEDRDYYIEKNEKMPPLKLGQINFIPIETGHTREGGRYVRVFIRNGHEIPFSLWRVHMSLLDESNKIVADGIFDTAEFGEIQMGETRLWEFKYPKENIKNPKADYSSFTIKVDYESIYYNKPLVLDFDEELKETLSIEKKKSLESWLFSFKQESNTIVINGFDVEFISEKGLIVLFVITNSTEKNVQIQKLPLTVKDKEGDIVCSSVVELGNLEVKAATAKPYQVIFEYDKLQKKNPDLSSWSVGTIAN